MPLWLRKLITDFVETGLAALFALALVIPGNLDEAKAQALVIGSALAGALIAATRRAVPEFLAWLRAKLGVTA